jgi:hypothetical protein
LISRDISICNTRQGLAHVATVSGLLISKHDKSLNNSIDCKQIKNNGKYHRDPQETVKYNLTVAGNVNKT